MSKNFKNLADELVATDEIVRQFAANNLLNKKQVSEKILKAEQNKTTNLSHLLKRSLFSHVVKMLRIQ